MVFDEKKEADNVNYNSDVPRLILLKPFLLLSIFFLMLFFLPMISAAEIQLQDPDSAFDSGETLLAVVSGNFVEQPIAGNVFFYRGHVRIPIDFNIEKINDDFYISAMLVGKTAGNYSISIEGTRYMNGTQVSSEDIVKNFTITQSTAAFSVNPGFINTQGSFFVEIQNLKPSQIVLQINSSENLNSNLGNSINIKSGEIKKITFDVQETFSETGTISFISGNSSYALPVFLSENLTVEEEKIADFNFEPETVSVSMATDSNAKRIVYLVNTGDLDLDDVTFLVSENLAPYVAILPEIADLEKNSTEKIEIIINSDAEEKIVEGDLIAVSESTNETASLVLIINFVKDYIPAEGIDSQDEIILTTCEQLKGQVCSDGFECAGESEKLEGGVCCLAECKEIKKSSRGKIIGWGIVVLIILFLFWFYTRRYRRVGYVRRF